MGAGLKTVNGAGYLTDRRTHREVGAADTDVDLIDEVLDTRFDNGGRPIVSGHRQTIVLYVLPDDSETCTVTLYGKSDEEYDDGVSSSSSAGVTEWSAYAVETGISNKMLVYVNMPAGEYKVMVTAISAGGVTIRESHST